MKGSSKDRGRYRICFVSSEHPPFDKRVFDKEAVYLAQAGFSVFHIAPGDGSRQKVKGVEVITYFRGKGMWGRIKFLPVLYKRSLDIDADCYHCNEVDSWAVGILLKLTRKKSVVFDVHEHYPVTFAEGRFPRVFRPLVVLVVSMILRVFSTLTDQIVFAKDSAVVDYPGTEGKRVLVRNYAPTSGPQVPLKDFGSSKKEGLQGVVTIVYFGLMSKVRGWPQLLEGMAMMPTSELRLHIIGTFNDGSLGEFNERVIELGIEGRVKVDAWMDYADAMDIVVSAQIGIILFQPNLTNNLHALPHKLFDYMLAGLPVVAPESSVEVARIVRDSACGILVDATEVGEIARALEWLAEHPQERMRLGSNGRRAVLERYTWEKEAATLVGMYDEFLRAQT